MDHINYSCSLYSHTALSIGSSQVLLGERNEAMTKALRNLNGKVVAVVGLAHLDGMEQLWHEANYNFLTGKQ